MSFRIEIPQADVDDLTARLARVRFPNVVDPADASGGVSVDFMRRLIDRWRDGYDWRAEEARLNELDHRITRIGGVDLHHVVHTGGQKVPVVLLHGWPDTFLRYRELAPLLAAAGHDVVVPSLPGFGFSSQPAEEISVGTIAELVHELMTGLGHERYAAHGGDWGSAVAEQLATAHPDAVVALHLADVPYAHQFGVDPGSATDAEKAFLEKAEAWAAKATYFTVQSAEPTLLSYGLSDSPVGLAAWLADKYLAWSDREPDLDTLLTLISVYWFGNTIRSSVRLYSEGLGSWDDSDWSNESSWESDGSELSWGESGPLKVPTAIAVFPADFATPPREFAERFFDVRRFTVMPAGGHFGALDEPAALAEDMVAFLATV